MHKPMLTREQIAFFIYRFRKFDVTKREQRQRLIDSFVNAVYLYEDKIILTFNYKDGSKTITLAEVEGSDLSVLGAPDRSKASFAPTYFFDKNKSSARSAPLLLIFRKKARYGFLILSFTFHYFYDNLLQPAPIRKQGYMLRTEFSALSFMSFSPLVSKYDLTFPYSLIKNETIKINSLIFDSLF